MPHRSPRWTTKTQTYRLRENWRAGCSESCTSGSEGRTVKPVVVIQEGARPLPYHELRERWLTDEWRFYETQQFRHQIPQKISPEDAQMLIQDRHNQIVPDVTPLNQSKRAQLFELLADMTDEDGAYSEMEDFGWLDEDLE